MLDIQKFPSEANIQLIRQNFIFKDFYRRSEILKLRSDQVVISSAIVEYLPSSVNEELAHADSYKNSKKRKSQNFGQKKIC